VWPDWAKFCCLSTFYLNLFSHFQLNKQLQNMDCGTYFNKQKELRVYVFGLSIRAWIFWLQFGLHFQILGKFLFNFLVTLPLICLDICSKYLMVFEALKFWQEGQCYRKWYFKEKQNVTTTSSNTCNLISTQLISKDLSSVTYFIRKLIREL